MLSAATYTISLNGRRVGPEHPCFIIAEAGVNHNGDVRLARQLVDAAAGAGADAVKFQTFKTELVMTRTAPKAKYQQETTPAGESQFDMVSRLELSAETHGELYAACRQRGIMFMSTPFDEPSAHLLADLGVAAFKIPSGEITNLPFLAHVARLGKPMIVSTGMAYLGEVEDAVREVEDTGNHDLVLLHCVSNYPADPADVNLRAMQTLASAFGLPVGYSDHTLGDEVALAAVALGACVVEKHFTLDRGLPGPDQRASMEPAELAALVRRVRSVEAALGHGRKIPAASEADTARVARRSFVASRDLQAGTVLTGDMIVLRRPGTGLPPALYAHVVGRTLRVPVTGGTLLTLEMLA